MARPLSLLIFVTALLALPAAAQQGPAGVPGAPLIGAEIAPPHPAPELPTLPEPNRKRISAQCRQAKDVERCEARLTVRAQAREACKKKPQAKRKQCVRNYQAGKK